MAAEGPCNRPGAGGGVRLTNTNSGPLLLNDADRLVLGTQAATSRGAGVPQGDVDITATAVMGDVRILGDSYAQPIRRTLRAWLTRDDRDRRAIE